MSLTIRVFLVTSIYLFLVQVTPASSQVTDQEVAYLTERINSIEKVDQLYSIRYAVGKYANRKDLTLRQQELLMRAMTLLSEEFKIRSHYRNAADVYKEYLEYNNKYLESYNAYAKDSLMAVHKKIEAGEKETIRELDAEIAALTKTREAVSGLKAKYYSFGSFGAIAVIVLTVLIFISRNKAIRNAEAQIIINREKIQSLHKQTSESGMTAGTVAFCRKSAAENVQVTEAIIESITSPEEKKLYQKELNALQQVSAKLNQVAS